MTGVISDLKILNIRLVFYESYCLYAEKNWTIKTKLIIISVWIKYANRNMFLIQESNKNNFILIIIRYK